MRARVLVSVCVCVRACVHVNLYPSSCVLVEGDNCLCHGGGGGENEVKDLGPVS